MTEVQIAEVRPGREEQRPQHCPASPLGSDVEHHHEQSEEQQRGPEIALPDQDGEADQPDDQDRPEVSGPRQVNAEHPIPSEREHLALLDQIRGEGDRQQHLGGLGRLEAVRADLNPDLGTELLGPQAGHQRQQQQHDAGEADRVGEPLQRPVIIEPGHDEDEHQHADRCPDQLLAGTIERWIVDQVDAVNHHQAEAVEQDHTWQDHWIRVRESPPHRDVREHSEQDGESGQVRKARGQLARDIDVDQRRTRQASAPARR